MLAALTASALALPGLALPGLAPDALADGPTERWSLETATSFYAEDDVDSDKVSSGSTSRYEIQTQQLQLKAPFTERTDLGLNVTYESMSGATPWFVEPGPDGDPVQVMTGATVEEERIDVLGTGSYYLDNGRLSLSGGLSNEKDYFAGNGGVEAEIHFNEKSTSLTTGLGFSLDTLEPTDADLFATRPKQENRQSVSAFAGISQVIRRNMALQSSLSFQRSTGFLADPYKLVSVGGVNLADSRPDERNQIAWLTRYRHHFDRMNGTLHADYRFSLDDWEIYAHSVELAYYQTPLRCATTARVRPSSTAPSSPTCRRMATPPATTGCRPSARSPGSSGPRPCCRTGPFTWTGASVSPGSATCRVEICRWAGWGSRTQGWFRSICSA
jgi:hypothetical protein